MIKLFPSEKLILQTETNPTIDERKNSRYLLVIGIILIFVAIFYRYASAQDWILTAVFWVSVIGTIMSIGAYLFKLYTAAKGKGSKKYYLTSRRIVETDANGKINREMLLAKVKRVDTNFIVGRSGDVIINPKDLNPQEEYRQRLKGSKEKQYAKETFVIKSIDNAREFADNLNK